MTSNPFRAALLSAAVLTLVIALSRPLNAAPDSGLDHRGATTPAPIMATGQAAIEAWETPYTAGPRCTRFTPAANVSGSEVIKSAPDFTITANRTLDCIDFTGWNVEVINTGTVATITNAKFQCRGCQTGHIIKVGVDSGGNPRGSPTVDIEHCSVDMSGFRLAPAPEANASIQVENASTTTFAYCSMINPPVDQLISTGTSTLILDHVFITAFCTNPRDLVNDHCEALHPHGSRVILRSVLIDARALGPIVGPITGDIYFDPRAGVHMVVDVGGSVFVQPPGFAYTIQVGGPGSIDFTIHDSVLRRGVSGYFSGWNAPGVTFHLGTNVRDFDTGVLIKKPTQ